MSVAVPTWFKQRQGKMEPVGEQEFRLSGPNLPPSWLGLRRAENGKLQGYLRASAEGGEIAATDPKFDRDYEAWEVAFEMYRQKMII